jgi:hypothetical protein
VLSKKAYYSGVFLVSGVTPCDPGAPLKQRPEGHLGTGGMDVAQWQQLVANARQLEFRHATLPVAYGPAIY